MQPLQKSIPPADTGYLRILHTAIPGLIHQKHLDSHFAISADMDRMIVNGSGQGFRNIRFVLGMIQRIKRQTMAAQPGEGLWT